METINIKKLGLVRIQKAYKILGPGHTRVAAVAWCRSATYIITEITPLAKRASKSGTTFVRNSGFDALVSYRPYHRHRVEKAPRRSCDCSVFPKPTNLPLGQGRVPCQCQTLHAVEQRVWRLSQLVGENKTQTIFLHSI